MAQESGSGGSGSGSATTGSFAPNLKPNLRIRPTSTPIRIDGVLDDPGWQSAMIATNFSETFPGDQAKPPIDIETRMTYDDTHVYFAFLIEDDPRSIRTTLRDRDQIWQDDYVGVILDTYGDHAWSYFLASNPIGVQGDTRIVNNGNEDVGFDVVFETHGQLTDSGYQVEMAIPFRSLRFPDNDVQNWNINFWITHPRESRNTYSWAAIDRDDPCWMCQMGTVSGIENVSPGRNIEFLPALTGSQSGALDDASNPNSNFDNGRLNADPSLGIKYAFSSNMSLDAAINPDFSQIEADADQVDVNTTFALFFQERRPFFQEGSDLFNTEINAVYTRSINNPMAATKLTGRFNRTSIAYIGARDRDTPMILPFEERSDYVQAGESFSNIVRIKQTFAENSHVGALFTDRRLDGSGAGSAFGVDGLFRFYNNYTLSWQVMGSHTQEPNDPKLSGDLGGRTFDNGKYTAMFDGETYSGLASSLELQRNGRHYGIELDYSAYSPTFRADNGFITQNNSRQLSLWQGYTFYPEDSFFDRITPSFVVGEAWNYDGLRKDQFMWLIANLSMKGQTFANIRYLVFSNERFAGVDFRNLRRLNLFFNSNFSNPVRVGGFASIGRSISRDPENPVMGKGRDFNFFASIKPMSQLVIEPSITYSALDNFDTGDEIFSGYIFRNRLSYQFTRRLFLRLVTQYNDFSQQFEVDPLVTYRINPFTAFYIGSTHDLRDFGRYEDQPIGYQQTSRQFFFKFQYLFRV